MHWKCLQSEQQVISKMVNNAVCRTLKRIVFYSIFKTFPPYIISLWKWPFLADNLSNSLCFIGCQTLLCPTAPTSPIFYWIRSWNFIFLMSLRNTYRPWRTFFCGLQPSAEWLKIKFLRKKHSFPPTNEPKGQIWNNCSLRCMNSS